MGKIGRYWKTTNQKREMEVWMELDGYRIKISNDLIPSGSIKKVLRRSPFHLLSIEIPTGGVEFTVAKWTTH
jgi:hypothetical protein